MFWYQDPKYGFGCLTRSLTKQMTLGNTNSTPAATPCTQVYSIVRSYAAILSLWPGINSLCRVGKVLATVAMAREPTASVEWA